ncbi:MAG: hypothetical protein AB1791_05675 [Chloroflexota bacterium]
MGLRHTTRPSYFVHDGTIQVEEAVKMVLAGRNPYLENYLDTPLAEWPRYRPSPAANPALYHLAYLPFTIVFAVPFYLVMQAAVGWFDLRLVYLLLLLLTLWLLPRLAPGRKQATLLPLAVALNPLFLPYFVEGRNDVFVLFWLVLSLVLLQKGRPGGSVVALALACASKLTAWFILPFYGLYFWRQVCRSDFSRQPVAEATTTNRPVRTALWSSLPYLALFLVILSVMILPFALWNPQAFLEDVWLYPSGRTLAHQYPLISLGLGGLGVALGWFPQLGATFPFSWLQLLFGGPTLLLLLYRQGQRNTLAQLWLNYGLLTLVIGLFSYVFNDNHLGYVTVLLTIGYLLQKQNADGAD